ncbi:NtaA/DmoA family FMN-dependent monooxygenase [Microbacterium gilvum]|uniref:NtaA/DmoA family FMN-dependent monooxygenase n=1 Tax=Microbacterium gilvum TaxID=1336204 RepID=A0ABP8ZVG0_9MICO
MFDLLFLGQGLRLREHRGELFELDVAGRPDSLALFAALSARTERIGLAATLNTTYTEPAELAAGLSTIDHLSNGRAAWNIVTSHDAYFGENFRRGGYLSHADRYVRAEEVIGEVEAQWKAAQDRLPQGRPVYIQAGDSADGRRFGARYADVIFSLNTSFDAAERFSADMATHLTAIGKKREELRILPIARVVFGDTAAEVEERVRENGFAQISGPRALAFAEQVWGRSLDGVDPEGPLPTFDPVRPADHLMKGRVQSKADPFETVARWRALADRDGHSLRSLMVAMYGQPAFRGTPSAVADEITRYTDAGVTDGFALGAYVMPGGFDEIVDRLVPELQERGVYPDRYEGTTARDHLGLAPVGQPSY